MRAGFVYKTEDDLIGTTFQAAARGSAPTRVPFTFIDIGVDGVRGTARRSAPSRCYGMPDGAAPRTSRSTRSSTNVAAATSRYKTVEVVDEQALRQQVVGVGRRRLHAG